MKATHHLSTSLKFLLVRPGLRSSQSSTAVCRVCLSVVDLTEAVTACCWQPTDRLANTRAKDGRTLRIKLQFTQALKAADPKFLQEISFDIQKRQPRPELSSMSEVRPFCCDDMSGRHPIKPGDPNPYFASHPMPSMFFFFALCSLL
eukprot:767247-Hanusia_phi.AAC.4